MWHMMASYGIHNFEKSDGTRQAVGEALKQDGIILINAEILPKSDSGIESVQAPYCRTFQEFHAETLPATLDALGISGFFA